MCLYLSDRRTNLEQAWRSLTIPDPVPDVDFDHELVVIWQTGIFALCDNWIRFDGYTLDTETNKLNAQATDFIYPYGCFAKGGTRHYIVAIESSELPPDITPGELLVTRFEPND